jgi:hypothetical protein
MVKNLIDIKRSDFQNLGSNVTILNCSLLIYLTSIILYLDYGHPPNNNNKGAKKREIDFIFVKK